MHDPLLLTQAQVAFFRAGGYLALEAITTVDEVLGLQAIYDRLFSERSGRNAGDHLDLVSHDDDDHEPALPQVLNPSKHAPELARTRMRANAESIARQLLGPQAAFRFDHAICKPARYGAATPWHQDEAYNAPDMDYNDISIWVPLQPATRANGCMQFMPRSHRWDVAPHRPIGDDPKVTGLEVTNPQDYDRSAVVCELPPGGATIHHCRTMHYTGPNLTDQPRRAYIMGFGAPPTPRATPRDFDWLRRQQTAWQARNANRDT
jgi:ectoine hydroxylase-related dioxygenase (phytanoyl-CoA dioxygenase family)